MNRLLLVLLLLPLVAHAQPAPERHSEVLIFAPDAAPDTSAPERAARHAITRRLAEYGLVLGHARTELTADGLALRVILSETELVRAEASGLDIKVLVEDVTAHYLATRSGTCPDGQGISRIAVDLCGPMGGFPTFDAIVAHLDAMQKQYPALISARTSLGQSHEGRDLWMVEISDNHGVEENEGEVLYTSLHHAREPGSMAAVLYFMYYLLENYGTEPEVTDLVDTRRLFFIPVVNPDGYVYNETTNPDGGGLWRKNRRNNGGGIFGVDLNRNYSYNWGYDDEGSSPFIDSQTYRGPAPFSEPETQAVRDFLEGGRRVSHAFNYHTYGDLLLYPWGYEEGAYTPDDALLDALAEDATAVNNYTYGPTWEVLYLTNGDAIDWMYGEQDTKPKIFAFLPEVGYSFWPDPADVYPLADENLEANLILAQAATPPPVANESDAAERDGVSLSAAYPNPVTGATRLGFTLRDAGPVRLTVHDVLGREVAVLFDGTAAAGPGEVVLDGADLPSGVYIVHLEAGGWMRSRRVTVLR